MADLTLNNLTLTGTLPTFTAAGAAGDAFQNDGEVYLHVKNGSAAPVTVTATATRNCSHGFPHNAVVSVAASGEAQIGPFPVDRFNNNNGKVSVTYSAVTTVTVAAVRV